MPEATALKKFHCPACGAEAQWNPAKQALVCNYCGATAPGEINQTNGEIQEHDLVTALREYSKDRRGWKTEKTSVKCQSCQAISVFDAAKVGQRCDFCGSAALVSYDQIQAPIRPESVLPFQISEAAVRESIRKWYGSRWFAPSALKTNALTDTVHGVYVPYWTFDAEAHADWTAESGYHYYTTETYRDSEGKTRTRQVQHTRWQPSSGDVDHFFDDELVPATIGVDQTLLKKVEPFPTNTLSPYNPSFLAGWVVEQYQIDLIAAAQHARARMDNAMRTLCATKVPGDTHRNLRVQTHYWNQTFKHILVPLWLLTFRYGAKNYQVLLNGYTGSIAGKHPLSWIKIALFILLILLAAGIGFLAANKT